MDQSYPTTVDDIFASWLDLLETEGYLYTLSMGSLSEPGYLPAPGDLLEPGNLPNYNTINDMAFPQAPMTSMGAFTSSLTQQYNTYQVSKLRFERRHKLTLLFDRTSLVLVPSWPNVCPVLASATTLCVHRDAKLSQMQVPPSFRRQANPIGLGFLPWPPTQWPQPSM